VPVLRINAAQSQVPLPVRQVGSTNIRSFNFLLRRYPQTLLKTLYDHFVILYKAILPANPAIASEHALKQEEEIYNKSTKLTYRHVSAFH